MIMISAFKWVPPFAQGYVRDLRPRWALEEAGLPYETMLIDSKDQASEEYLKLQPFGQVPAMKDGDLTLFESGAIVLHIAGLAKNEFHPKDEAAAARARTWVIAALNSLEPFVANLVSLDVFYADEEWARLRKPSATQDVERRLDQLSYWLKDREYLDGAFSAGDIVMATVLRDLGESGLLEKSPILVGYLTRCLDRPAFRRALAAQMADFREPAKAG